MNRPAAILAVVLLAAGVTTPAWAGDEDATTAEALFVAGREAIDRGDYAAACAKFAESDRLDPAAGTRINLAECKERVGQIASAWRHWREAVDLLDAEDERRPIVRERIASVERRVPRLTIRLVGGAPGARIVRDGLEIGVASLSVPLPVDPGKHVIRVAAPGHADAVFSSELGEGNRSTVDVSVGAKIATPAAEARLPGPRTSVLRGVGVGLGVAGGVVVLAGGAFGLAALSAKSSLETNCFPETVCNDRGADSAERGRTYATISTVGVIAGGALLAAGLALFFFTHPRVKSSATGFTWHGTGGAALGTF